jgi:hypothetical protein
MSMCLLFPKIASTVRNRSSQKMVMIMLLDALHSVLINFLSSITTTGQPHKTEKEATIGP